MPVKWLISVLVIFHHNKHYVGYKLKKSLYVCTHHTEFFIDASYPIQEFICYYIGIISVMQSVYAFTNVFVGSHLFLRGSTIRPSSSIILIVPMIYLI